jgi:plastocyanin
MRRSLLPICLGLAAIGLTSCGTDDRGSIAARPTPKTTVVMKDIAYDPPAVRIPVGSRVTWINLDENAHTAETLGAGFFEFDRMKLADKNLFDIHTVQQGEAESVLFDTPGTYRYHSSFDPTMKGIVEVTP